MLLLWNFSLFEIHLAPLFLKKLRELGQSVSKSVSGSNRFQSNCECHLVPVINEPYSYTQIWGAYIGKLVISSEIREGDGRLVWVVNIINNVPNAVKNTLHRPKNKVN